MKLRTLFALVVAAALSACSPWNDVPRVEVVQPEFTVYEMHKVTGAGTYDFFVAPKGIPCCMYQDANAVRLPVERTMKASADRVCSGRYVIEAELFDKAASVLTARVRCN